jgi:serine/threonine protein kinase
MPRERLWAWVHGESDSNDDAAEVAEHVSACQDCTARVAEMHALLSGLQDVARSESAVFFAAKPPQFIGEYRIIQKIGAGGMGVVFEAEQPQPRRRVALKVIRESQFADEHRVRLFRREMQMLARLNHPGIAAIYGAGVTPDGHHFFAMELVDGVSLTEFVNGSGNGGPRPAASIGERLRLFHEVCEAVSYAHQRGVIHRDLKPGNILVSKELSKLRNDEPKTNAAPSSLRRPVASSLAQPKVLDFGLARMSSDTGEATIILSQAGSVVGTLAYMSPEQARGDVESIDVRTDVYALGMILYELLTGAVPYEVGGRPLHEAVEIICNFAPARPTQFNRAVPADVSTIALKALEKEPDRRYQTVAELAGDVERFLGNHPIKARPASGAYRARKFIARNRVTVALLTALFMITVSAAITFAIQGVRIADQRDLARREADKFREINHVLTNLFSAGNMLDPWNAGSPETRVIDVLDAAAARIAEDVRTPLVAAALRHTLAKTYRSISEYDQAARHLEFAVETRTRELGRNHPETIDSVNELGEVLFELGGPTEAAHSRISEALRLYESLPRPPLREVAKCVNSIGLILQQRGELTQSEDYLRRALNIRSRLAESARNDPATPPRELVGVHDNLAQTLNNLAGLLRRLAASAGQAGDRPLQRRLLEEASRNYLDSLELRRQWRGPEHPEVAKMLNNHARCLRDMGLLDEAVTQQGAALALLEKHLGQRHRYTARARYNLAELLADLGQHDAARTLCQQALAVQTEVLDGDHRDIRDSRALLDRLE